MEKILSWARKHQILFFFAGLFVIMVLLFPDRARTQNAVEPTSPEATDIKWTLPETIVVDPKAAYLQPSLAIAPSGKWHLAYHMIDQVKSETPGYYTHIIVQEEGGEPTILITAFNSSAGGLAVDQPSLAVDHTGALHLVYLELEFDSYGLKRKSFNYTHNIYGVWSLPDTIYYDSGYIYETSAPDLAVDMDQTWHVVFQETYSGKSYINYMSGDQPYPITLVDAYGYGSGGTVLNLPSVAVGEDNGVHIAYQHVDFSILDKPINGWIMYMNNTAGLWSLPQAIQKEPKSSHLDPSLVIDSEGHWHVAFYDFYPSGKDNDNYLIKYKNSGIEPVIVARGRVTDMTGDFLLFPSIAMNMTSPRVHIAFQKTDREGPHLRQTSVMYTRSYDQ
jgi:hypothetical protein